MEERREKREEFKFRFALDSVLVKKNVAPMGVRGGMIWDEVVRAVRVQSKQRPQQGRERVEVVGQADQGGCARHVGCGGAGFAPIWTQL